MPSPRAIVIFAKLPVPGRVKTRLLAILSPRQAADLHRACLEDTIGLVDSIGGCRRFFDVAGSESEARQLSKQLQLGADWTVGMQRGRDLGARLKHTFENLFRRGMRRVVVIGTDTPWMGRERIRTALRLTNTADVVLGPAADGGYYLIAARRLVPAIFCGIPWGRSQVMAATLKALRASGTSFRLLPRDFDLDRPDDLCRAAETLRKKPERAPFLAGWLARREKTSRSSRLPGLGRRSRKRPPGRE